MLLAFKAEDAFDLVILLSQKDTQILLPLFSSLWQLSKTLESIAEMDRKERAFRSPLTSQRTYKLPS